MEEERKKIIDNLNLLKEDFKICKLPDYDKNGTFEELIAKVKSFEEKIKADFRVKFSVLRKGFPDMSIPDPNWELPVYDIKDLFYRHRKKLQIEESIDNNQVYIMLLAAFFQLIAIRWLKLPAYNFVENQWKSINKYKVLLAELGERESGENVNSITTGWPTEFKILALMLINMFIFEGMHFMMKKSHDPKQADNFSDKAQQILDSILTGNNTTEKVIYQDAENATVENGDSVKNTKPQQGMDGFTNGLGGIMNLISGLGNTQGTSTGGMDILGMMSSLLSGVGGGGEQSGGADNTSNNGGRSRRRRARRPDISDQNID